MLRVPVVPPVLADGDQDIALRVRVVVADGDLGPLLGRPPAQAETGEPGQDPQRTAPGGATAQGPKQSGEPLVIHDLVLHDDASEGTRSPDRRKSPLRPEAQGPSSRRRRSGS